MDGAADADIGQNMLSYSTCCQLNKTTAAIAAVVEIISGHRCQKIALFVAAVRCNPVAYLLKRELILAKRGHAARSKHLIDRFYRRTHGMRDGVLVVDALAIKHAI